VSDDSSRIAVVGMGGVASVGLYPEAIAAAVAGGLSRIQTVETMRHARTGDPLKLALTSRLPVHARLKDRLLWLGETAARQALAAVAGAPPLRLAVLLATPSAHAGLPKEASARVVAELISRLALNPVRELCLAAKGADGGVMCLGLASDLLRDGRADICLVGGIDSYCDTDALEPLALADRLKNDDAPAGLMPGEGAGFLVLMRSETAAQLLLPCLAQVVRVAAKREPNSWYTQRSTQGQGLTRAMRRVFKDLPPSLIADVTYSDASGEHWRAEEWAFAYLRNAERHGDPIEVRHPGDAWGDVGAATAFLLLATAIVDFRRGRSRGPGILVCCSSDSGPFRGAVLAEAQTGGV
jgi:3-oxoacyl-[acyl-carrier-protein] synthase I